MKSGERRRGRACGASPAQPGHAALEDRRRRVAHLVGARSAGGREARDPTQTAGDRRPAGRLADDFVGPGGG